MSLADELLADLEEGGEVEQTDGDLEPVADIEEVGAGVMEVEEMFPADSVRNVAKLRDSEQLKDILDSIEYFQKHVGKREVSGPTESDPEYQVIVDANNIIVEILNEINVIHKFVRDLYNKRFPELESLVHMPLEYVKTVKELGNNIDKSKNNEVLQDFLTPATIMVVSVTASTTQGSPLEKEDLDKVNEACDMAVDLMSRKSHIEAYVESTLNKNINATLCLFAVDLMSRKSHIQAYVESRMTFIAPNLSIIVGASTAAKLMGVAGGLSNLSKMPACNLLVLGAQKKTLSGFSSTAILPHTGFIYYSDIVQATPPDLRKKASRLIAAKCTLAARVDAFHESQDGKVGDDLLSEIQGKLDKLQEPPPVKTIKPLPAPIDAPRKKRGGRRYRKMKERLGMTEMRRQANRMNFGEIEDDAYQEDLGLSMGALGKSSGKVRGPVVDSKTKLKISKTLQQKISKTQTWGGSTTVKKQVSGTASSVAFTPLQGLEIVNPHAAERQVEAGSKSQYFSTTAGFLKLGNKKLAPT